MQFDSNRPIYLQILDSICEQILDGKLEPDGRILSVREYGAQLGVNPNTIMRSYERLTNDGIIYNKRGLGYFVTAGAKKEIKKARKQEFMKQTLPEMFRQMKLLDITIEDIQKLWQQ